ncbi:aryl-alcohol dehydrogenase-like predicted oxidoreductase [Natronocella acetinitrilica]|uniref:Protein tas n=1 Tax=Natronocella acetinitrilica TaxID=414046 RepID=A0AAE3G0F4_9GAMM|nr:NADP(H)-dependent aldo-keto reductase [Natronocella acetinitrilica]MCP1673095.1 aryl-alcohol dehydrogenase-like predicted oxidoreductase [Natronocella acetinitrilica]
MDFRPLGTTDLNVSVICLGTMTWGEQNTEAEAHEQLSLAVDQGVNFIDTAELYPVPPRGETQGLTEDWIGTWLKQRSDRDKLVIATKISGPGPDHIRGGATTYNREHIRQAVNDSLRRLQTDYIDLYQLHWPTRNANFFGKLGYRPKADDDGAEAAMVEALEALDEQVKAGKIRHVGLSNETAWGAMKFLQLAQERGLPRMQSIQNPYSLLNRSYEVGLAEVSHRERCGLLAYSPLGFGTLSGKYLNDQRPAGARLTLFDRFQRYLNPLGANATERYVALAREHGLDPGQMALAFVNSRSFLTSTIIGATTTEQLRSNIDSARLTLNDAVLEGIETIHTAQPNPCP